MFLLCLPNAVGSGSRIDQDYPRVLQVAVLNPFLLLSFDVNLLYNLRNVKSSPHCQLILPLSFSNFSSFSKWTKKVLVDQRADNGVLV